MRTAQFLPLALLLAACVPTAENIEETIRKANVQLENGQEQDAIGLLESLNARLPGNAAILEALAFAYSQSGQPILAGITFAQIAETNASESHFLLYAGQSMRDAGEPQQAVAYYEKYLKTYPDSSTAWKTLGEISESLNEPLQAAESYLRAHQLNPSGEIAVRVGRIFHGVGNEMQAKTWFKDAVSRADGQESDALLGLFEIALIEKDFTNAEVIARRLDRDYPGEIEVSALAEKRGELKTWKAKQDELARQLAAQERITRELKEKAAREAAALVAVREDALARSTDAEQTTEAATSPAGPQSRREVLAEAEALKTAGDLTGAITKFWQAIKMDDTKAQAWYQLSDAQFADNQVAWAEGTALEAVRREPINARYTLHYLKVVQASKKPSEFLRELVKAKTRISDSPEITLALARAYSVIGGSNRNAAILYREFLEMAPRHPERTVAEEELAAIPGQFSRAF